MNKDYNFLCGVSEHDDSDYVPTEKQQEQQPQQNMTLSRFMIAFLYFCHQRPGIFVASYLLLQGEQESKIGLVLFVSGIIAITIQTPAGQLVDEIHNKTIILIMGNVATIIGCILLTNFPTITISTIAVTANVASDAFVYPSLYATTLGIFGYEDIQRQAPLNETGTHLGNATFAIVAGIIVIFFASDAGSIFYICVAMRCGAIFVILQYISKLKIDLKQSRGLVDVSLHSNVSSLASVTTIDLHSTSKDSWSSLATLSTEKPMSYKELLSDRYVIIFLSSVLLFHFSNAAMLPLLSQQLFINSRTRGNYCNFSINTLKNNFILLC